MNLGAMMCLVIEEVADGHRRHFQVIFALVVCVRDRSPKKDIVQSIKKEFDPGVLVHSCSPQIREVIEQYGVEKRRRSSISLKPCHPYPIAQQDVIQQAVDTAERALALFPILGIVQPGALLKQPLVCDSVVASKHLKVTPQVHVPELTPDAASTARSKAGGMGAHVVISREPG